MILFMNLLMIMKVMVLLKSLMNSADERDEQGLRMLEDS